MPCAANEMSCPQQTEVLSIQKENKQTNQNLAGNYVYNWALKSVNVRISWKQWLLFTFAAIYLQQKHWHHLNNQHFKPLAAWRVTGERISLLSLAESQIRYQALNSMSKLHTIMGYLPPSIVYNFNIPFCMWVWDRTFKLPAVTESKWYVAMLIW